MDTPQPQASHCWQHHDDVGFVYAALHLWLPSPSGLTMVLPSPAAGLVPGSGAAQPGTAMGGSRCRAPLHGTAGAGPGSVESQR